MWSAFLAGAVVGEEHDDGVVELSGLFEVGDESSDLCVAVFEEAGEGFLEGGHEALCIGGEVVPGSDAGVAGGEFGVGRDDAQLKLSLVPLFADLVPSDVEFAAVAVDVFAGA